MTLSRQDLSRASGHLAFASAVSILVSITTSQTLLALALIALLASREKLQLPRIWLPLALFLAGTLISLILSPNPIHGLPQVKKIFVFSILLVVYSTLRKPETARRLVLFWGGVGAAVACLGVVQFIGRWRQAQALHVDFYSYYVDKRVTGTLSHWMTFAGTEMVVLLMLLAFLFFAPQLERRACWTWSGCVALLGIALLLNGTRTVWLGAAVAGLWLLWGWKRWMAIALPPLLLLTLWLAPGPVHDRLFSIVRPQKNIDSNEFRWIAFRAGIRMIEAYPIRGIGLEETKYQFLDYIPPDTPRPLPPGFYEHLHNFYLQFAAERGIPTLLMMLWMLLLILYDSYRALQRLLPGRSNERFLLNGGIATTIGIMLSGLFEVNLGDTEVLTVFLVVVAIGYLAVRQGAARPAQFVR